MAPPLILSGKTTLSQLAGVLLHANLFVSNDSGPMHMANAIKVPVVAIFGPTDPELTGPYEQPASVVKIETGIDCWPCRNRECPTDHRCMEGISASDVYSACERFLS
ncbi:glycosyltransferase family 9 protein [Acidobacteriota bacterium]